MEATSLIEKDGPNEVTISSKVLIELAEETKIRSLEDSGEFLVYILDKEGSQIAIGVGRGHKYGIMTSAEETVFTLKPFITEGFKIIADYHNHPSENVDVYKAMGFSENLVASPSGGDVDIEELQKIQKELGQEPYPRLIGLYFQKTNKVLINGFEVLRDFSRAEEPDLEFEDPFFKSQKPTDTRITWGADLFSNPTKMVEKGIIKPVLIKTVGNNLTGIDLNMFSV